MDTPTQRISGTTAGFMLAVAAILDGLQVLLTIPVIFAPLSILVTFLAACIFGIWFAILGVSYVSGKNAGLKLFSAAGSLVVELVPLLDGLPTIVAGVSGVIFATRLEDAAAIRKAQANGVYQVPPQTRPRVFPRTTQLSDPANENAG